MTTTASPAKYPSTPHESNDPVVVLALYKFVHLPDHRKIRTRLLELCEATGIRGTLLLATEGINGTVSGRREAIESVLEWLAGDTRFSDLHLRLSSSPRHPFRRLKVRIKSEIVTLGQMQADPQEAVGVYVEPSDWNSLIEDPSVRVIDTRNDYEYALGTFKGAQNPQTAQFRAFPEFVDQALADNKAGKVALFCTGGIRCEKATAYLLKQGFEQVYHLKGGILNYLQTIAPEQSLWRGECFVFDARVGLTNGLQQGSARSCQTCGWAWQPVTQTGERTATTRCGHCNSPVHLTD